MNIYPKITGTYTYSSNAIIFTKQDPKLTNYARFNKFCNNKTGLLSDNNTGEKTRK